MSRQTTLAVEPRGGPRACSACFHLRHDVWGVRRCRELGYSHMADSDRHCRAFMPATPRQRDGRAAA